MNGVISVIFDSRYHTWEVALRCYAFGNNWDYTYAAIANCIKYPRKTRLDLQMALMHAVLQHCWSSRKIKYKACVTPASKLLKAASYSKNEAGKIRMGENINVRL